MTVRRHTDLGLTRRSDGNGDIVLYRMDIATLIDLIDR